MIALEDKIAIGELIARFAHCSDFGDWEGLKPLFAEDIETEMEGSETRFRGIDGQIAHAKVSAEQTGGKNRHYYINLMINQADGQVFAEYMFMNVNAGTKPMGASIVVTGRMRDTVVKTAQGWQIARRYVCFDQDVMVTA